MPNRTLTPEELREVDRVLAEVRQRLERLSGADRELLFAYRRKVYKELTYDERGKPMDRRRLKAEKRKAQGGLCALCRSPLPATYAVLDRFSAAVGYTPENTRLICQACDTLTQQSRGYT